jgi:hypothetical protein
MWSRLASLTLQSIYHSFHPTSGSSTCKLSDLQSPPTVLIAILNSLSWLVPPVVPSQRAVLTVSLAQRTRKLRLFTKKRVDWSRLSGTCTRRRPNYYNDRMRWAPRWSLPFETLSIIFEFACSAPGLHSRALAFHTRNQDGRATKATVDSENIERDHFQLVIGAVSSQWRSIVQTSPWLWTSIQLEVSQVSAEQRAAFLRLSLTNSKWTPISLSLHYADDFESSPSLLIHETVDPLMIESFFKAWESSPHKTSSNMAHKSSISLSNCRLYHWHSRFSGYGDCTSQRCTTSPFVSSKMSRILDDHDPASMVWTHVARFITYELRSRSAGSFEMSQPSRIPLPQTWTFKLQHTCHASWASDIPVLGSFGVINEWDQGVGSCSHSVSPRICSTGDGLECLQPPPEQRPSLS